MSHGMTNGAPAGGAGAVRVNGDGCGRSAASARLRERIGEAAFERYFGGGSGNAARLELERGRLRVRVANRFTGSLIERRFGGALTDAAQAGGLSGAAIEVDASLTPVAGRGAEAARRGPDPARTGRSAGGSPSPRRDAPATRPGFVGSDGRSGGRFGGRFDGSRLGGRGRTAASGRRLEDFVVGAPNRSAYEACCRLGDAASEPGFGPVVLYGPCGVGKTHLLQGVASRFAETSGEPASRAVRYTTAEAFTSAYVEAVKKGSVASFQRRYRGVSLLCIDDVHFLAKKDGTQRELLHTFDALGLAGARIVLVSDEHPRELKLLSEPLVSRFVGGVVVRIDAPDEPLAERIVSKLVERRGMALGEGAARAIVTWARASAVSRGDGGPSVRELEGAVSRLRATATVSPELLGPGGTVGAVIVDAALGEIAAGSGVNSGPGSGLVSGRGAGRVRLRDIVEASAATLGVSVSELMGRGRHKRVVLARSIASYLGREMTSHSTPEIAVKLGRTNHSTVVTASRRLRKQIDDGVRVDAACGADGVLVSEVVDQVRRRVRAGL